MGFGASSSYIWNVPLRMIWNQCTTLLVDVYEYRCGYAASFCSGKMLTADQLKRKRRDVSINRTKMGGYRMDCHMVADGRMVFRPNARYKMSGDAFTKASTMPDATPFGDMAGASAMKTSTFSFNVGWMDKVANACAVPCEKPMYDKDG